MNILIDSWGWIEIFEGTQKADKLLQLIENPKNTIYTTVLNVYEVWYQVTKRSSREKAEEIVNSINKHSTVFDINQPFAVKAASIHLQEGLSAIDSFVYAAASAMDCHIVTGDRKDFGRFKKVISI
ncbi:PIN domain-containing protein [Candidatus Micrarchaeota archaeon]|nr:PIN domain-containing protein [Candidatus Micrarchaeota archaeon]